MENRARILSMETGIRNSAADRPRIMLNVGGKMFETTVSTLQSSGPDSLLAALSLRPSKDPIFIDRDPEIFSVLLFLLRTNRLPSTAFGFSKQELSEEALYYGIEPHLRLAASPPPLSGIDASIVATIHPASEAHPSAFTADGDDGSVCVAHVGQISSYDWNLSHVSTIRTHLDSISSIRRIRPQVACMGSNSAAGLHFYDLYSGSHHGSISWTDTTDPRIYKARVTSICCSQHQVFASFNCPHGENSILLVDKSTLQISSEIGRQSGRSAKHVVPGKLTWLPETGLVVASAVTSGAFGYSGYVRIWDPRSSSVVWEVSEPGSGRSSRYGDPFADVDVAVAQLTLFKLCSRSGDLAMADLRKLSDDPWVYLEDKNPGMKYTGRGSDGIGSNSLIHCYQDQVFVGREAGLEVWSRANRGEGEDGYRRNFVDKVQDSERGMIKQVEGGGDRLFVSREDVEGLEVWETSSFSCEIPV